MQEEKLKGNNLCDNHVIRRPIYWKGEIEN